VFVKICGITNLEDALAAEHAGAHAVGLNFWRPGKRYVTPGKAAEIAAGVKVKKVGVFVDEEIKTVLEIARTVGLDALQLHGSETPEYVRALAPYEVWKAVKMTGVIDWPSWGVKTFVLDSPGPLPGGTGATFDWILAHAAKEHGRVILAGGLNPENVAAAIREVRPWGVDVASGVELSPRQKDHHKIRAFVHAARSTEDDTR
jgi:phosphoribosylanthranilate isomerase